MLVLFTGNRRRVSIPQQKLCDNIIDCKSCKKIASCQSASAKQCDECNCSANTHFYCSNGNPLFVDRRKVEDGINDCSDGSDECPPNYLSNNPLSSKDQLIKSMPLRVLVWLMAVLALIGNLTVGSTTVRKVYSLLSKPSLRPSNIELTSNVLVLNLSVADFLMGVVLLFIGIKSVEFSGRYCFFDKVWRTSTACNVIGVLTAISSETSVMTLVCITCYRLYGVYRPLIARNASLKLLSLYLIIIWLTSFLIALLPFSSALSSYMVTNALVSKSVYFRSDVTDLFEFSTFARRISGLSNDTLLITTGWSGIDAFLKQNYSALKPNISGYFGYYSASGVCLPKFYRSEDNDTQFNVMTSVVITFKLFRTDFYSCILRCDIF